MHYTTLLHQEPPTESRHAHHPGRPRRERSLLLDAGPLLSIVTAVTTLLLLGGGNVL